LGQLGLAAECLSSFAGHVQCGSGDGAAHGDPAGLVLPCQDLGREPYYRKAIVIPLSALIAAIATFLVVQRIFF